MALNANALRWDGNTGHYEVYYLTLTDPATGVGLWIRYTMLAPVPRPGGGAQATCSLWLLAMDPERGRVTGHKESFPAARLQARTEPFELRVADAVLSDRGMTGAVAGARWDLRWEPRLPAAEHVHPILRRARIARTVLVLPH